MSESTITIIGLTAATLTTASFVPQVLQTIKTRRTKDINLRMYVILALGLFLWVIYGLILNSPPILFANATTLILASVILYLKLKHG